MTDQSAIRKLCWAFNEYQDYVSNVPWGGDAPDFSAFNRKQLRNAIRKSSRLLVAQEEAGVAVLPVKILEDTKAACLSLYHQNDVSVSP